ncbi:hypothetical protein VB773_08685 [Haloarculaceae archaeon H-GB2-1]|nr:hypothetical protein [Haloarculaceae archaeon H-GB11]MEA5407635.1 hypothetical protein [Haloarculaceae archaeon H-GB2-1]
MLHTYGEHPDSPTLMRHEPAMECTASAALVTAQKFDTDETIHVGAGSDRVHLVEGDDASGIASNVPSGSSVSSTSNEGVVELTARRASAERKIYQTGGGNALTVDVGDTTAPDAWGRYLERTGWTHASGTTYECTADTVVVRSVTIKLGL